MRKLIRKEISLCMHPTAPLFMMLSAMVMIPDYPYYVLFFYTCLAVFFTCLTGRENNDVVYSMLLPISKRDVVKARYLFTMLLEAGQMAIAIAFCILKSKLSMPPNQVGMDANIAFFAFSLPMLGVFHWVFFGGYYRNVERVGVAFVKGSAAVFVYVLIAEACAHAVPFVRERLDTPDPAFMAQKLAALLIGALLYAGITYLSYRRSVKHFELQDL